jgi:hypothetical protein
MRRHTIQFELPGQETGTLLRVDVAVIETPGNGNGSSHTPVAAPRGFLPEPPLGSAPSAGNLVTAVREPLAFAAPRGFLV